MSGKDSKIIAVVGDARLAEALQENLPAGGELTVVFCRTESELGKLGTGTLVVSGDGWPRPVRLGALLDHIGARLAQGDEPVSIGPYVLKTSEAALYKGGREAVRLTEKERDLLLALSRHRGETAVRQEILEAVWGYGQALETHTLETHIYRLRQKIEKDPARPEIILTEEDGYRLV